MFRLFFQQPWRSFEGATRTSERHLDLGIGKSQSYLLNRARCCTVVLSKTRKRWPEPLTSHALPSEVSAQKTVLKGVRGPALQWKRQAAFS